MDQQRLDRLEAGWLDLLRPFAVAEAEAGRAFRALAQAYREPGRFYHNLDHIAAVLETVEGLRDLALDPAAVRLAAWFHDVVYDSRAPDNEERSAALARECCAGWEVPGPTVAAVSRLVLATKTHQAAAADVDAHILLDADLAILGAPEEEYDRYARAIRQEYAWVPEEDYHRGRAQVLESFFRRERIYLLDRMHERLDVAARRNLRRELAALGT